MAADRFKVTNPANSNEINKLLQNDECIIVTRGGSSGLQYETSYLAIAKMNKVTCLKRIDLTVTTKKTGFDYGDSPLQILKAGNERSNELTAKEEMALKDVKLCDSATTEMIKSAIAGMGSPYCGYYE